MLENSQEALNEVGTISKLKLLESPHPNIVQILELQECEPNRMCIVMEFVPFDLTVPMEASEIPLQCGEVKCIMYQIVKALMFLHEKNVIHRDVKPSNVLYDGAGRVRLCDFGLAKEILPLSHNARSTSSLPMTRKQPLDITVRQSCFWDRCTMAQNRHVVAWVLVCELVLNKVTFQGAAKSIR